MKPRAVVLVSLLTTLLLALPGLGLAQEIPASQALEEGRSQAQAIRGLEFEQDVPVRFYSRDELRQYLLDDRDRLYPPEQREEDEAVLKLLGLIPVEVDYQQLMIDLETENISAFYENEEDYIALLADQEYLGPYERNTILHEYVHALQDQHFDIHQPPLYDDREGVNDLTLAGISLVEGDASVCNTIYYTIIPEQDYRAIFEKAASIPTPVYDSAPSYVQARLYFPYQEGLGFGRYLYDGGGFEAVNRAYDDPPDSSEQVIHPEKYLADEEPKAPELPDIAASLGKSWGLELTGVAGEFHLSEMLKAALSEEEAARAAAGWGGSRYYYYSGTDGDGLLAVALDWDSDTEAEEFADALAVYAESRLGADTAIPSDGGSGWRSWSDGDTAIALSRNGTRTDLVFTDRPGILGKAGAALGGGLGDFPQVDEEPAGSSSTAAIVFIVAGIALLAALITFLWFARRRKAGSAA